MTVCITRFKVYPCAARPGAAWNWHYKVNGDHACDRLSTARSIARRLYPGATIIETWKAKAEATR